MRGAVWTKAVSAPPAPAGRKYAARYDPENPDDARVATVVDFWLFPVLGVTTEPLAEIGVIASPGPHRAGRSEAISTRLLRDEIASSSDTASGGAGLLAMTGVSGF